MTSRQSLRIALFSVDPPALTYFHGFDPETNSIASQINEGLVTIDEEGMLQPSLAVSWRQVSPVALELELRQGVRFHNGDPFDADDVVASFAAHYTPSPSPAALVMLGAIKQVSKLDSHRVRVESALPDVLLLRRLLFMQVYPKRQLERGRDACEAHPIGTGAYMLARYTLGKEIVLERNPDHWAQLATVDELQLPILRQKEWVHRLSSGELDVALNLDSHDGLRAQRIPGVRGASREAAVAQLFLLKNQGPLADVRVRRALNHAINRRILVDLTEHGLGLPQRSMANRQSEGFVEFEPYRYSPELARQLLEAAGYAQGFRLRGLVSETSTALYFAVREFLARIDVTLEAEIVPRGVWMQTMMMPRTEPKPFDFAVMACDNPLLHTLFLHFAFNFSQGPASLTSDAGLDERLLRAATSVEDPGPAVAEVERYHRDQALMLFTVQQHAHAAWREGLDVVLPRSGHFGAAALWNLRIESGYQAARALPSLQPPTANHDLATLLDATSHTGAFYLSERETLNEPIVRRIWTNLTESEQRWRVQNEPMLRELVSAIEARTNLANVLSSTDRVAIVGHSVEGRRLFHNRGYELMFGGDTDRSVFDYLGDSGAHGWPAIREAVERDGSWLGPVHIPAAERPRGAPGKLFLTVSPARDDDGVTIGHTLVFSDFSGEEERIRTSATRTILECVPYGLFMLDGEGRMLSGYSNACRNIFPDVGSTELTGRPLVDLLRLDARRAEHFRAAYMQVMDDLLPSEVTLGQLPDRIAVGPRTYRLRGSIVRAEDGSVRSVLFTLLDISPLIAAEREAEHHRATALILRHRDSFEHFARDFAGELGRWSRASALTAEQPAIRASLHTAKGVLAQFALGELAEHIHRLEDQAQIAAGALAELQRQLHETLAGHGLSLTGEEEPVYANTERFLRALEADILAAKDAVSLRAAVVEGFERLRDKPAQELLGPLQEAAEQLARRRDKRVRVQLTGAEIRVSARHADVLGRLVHLMRNAIDHGLESSQEREHAHKDPVGTLALHVERTPSLLKLRVSDDGRGIDAGKVLERALALSVVSRAGAATLDRQAQLQLIFLDGLSTADSITDSSGRGVGLAATRQAVEAAGGRIEVASEPGRGTTFDILLPL